MLVLTRKAGESIVIGDNIEVTVIETKGEQIRLGITAPKEVDIHRKELFEVIQQANQQAANQSFNINQLFGKKE